MLIKKMRCFVLLVLMMSGCFGQGVEYTENQFIVTNGQRQITFAKGETYSIEGAAFGGSSQGNFPTLFLLPMAKAAEFIAKYGDFEKCKNKGAAEAQAAVISMQLIAVNDKVKGSMKKIISSVNASLNKGKVPSIHIDTVKLKAIKDVLIVNGQEAPLLHHNELPFYLVSDIRIVKDDFH